MRFDPNHTARLALAALALVAGCFHVDPPEGVYACISTDCPAGLICASDHFCRRHDVDAGALPDGDMVSPPEDCNVVYVSVYGDSANSGCQQHPLRDLGPAIALAAPAHREVHVCKGRYVEETLQLFGATVRGGYDCQTWQRTASYGYPSFDAVNETVIVNAANTPVMTVVAGPTTLDGLTIRAQLAAGDPAISKTLDLGHGQISVSDCDIAGVDTVATVDNGSSAVFIHDDADVDFAHNLVNGGGGSPSIGVHVDDSSRGRVHIHDNTVDGGTGHYDFIGSVGIDVSGNALTLATGTAIEHNIIHGGAGNHGVGSTSGTYAAAGLAVNRGGAADVIENVIDGGQGQDQNSTLGLHRAGGTAGLLRVLRNRISGGHTEHGQWPVFGVRIFGPGDAEVSDNMIFATADGSPGGARAIGVGDGPANMVIRHNTVFVDSNDFGAAVSFDHDVRGVIIENNLFAGSAGNAAAALFTEDCPDLGILKSLRNNLNVALPLLHYGDVNPSGGPMSSCSAGQTWTRDDQGEAELRTRSSSAQVMGNVTVSNDCAGDADCIVRTGCTAPAGCARDLFEPGVLGDEPTLFQTGWKLTTGIPCAVARSSLDLSQAVPIDLYGRPRPHTPTMGAQQVDGTIACVP